MRLQEPGAQSPHAKRQRPKSAVRDVVDIEGDEVDPYGPEVSGVIPVWLRPGILEFILFCGPSSLDQQ